MTPTLLGRWETRFFLFAILGGIISLVVSLVLSGFKTPLVLTPFAVLGYVFLFGLVWDAIYQNILYSRWDRDWPTTFQVLAGIVEGALVWLLIHYVGLPGAPSSALPLSIFLIHYGSIWLSIFVVTQGPLRVALPRWRFRGGEWF
jgi:hypothetical protein